MSKELKAMALVFEHITMEDSKEQFDFEKGIC